jgi:uncharacterized MAPEG superfamily protein
MVHTHLSVFVAGSAFLFLKMFANTGVQGYCRFRYKSFKYREDEPFFGVALESARPQPELLTRADACWRNDLENIPAFWVASLCGMLVPIDLGTYTGLVVTYCAARFLHTVFLLWGRQPWRFLAYAVALFCCGLMFVSSLRGLGW